MKRDGKETLCWIMRWGWMKWKRSLAFNNDDDKKLYNLKIYLHKKINKKITNLPTQPAVFLVCPCNIPWNGNQKQIKGNFSISNQVFWNLLLTDFNMQWLDSELQTIIYTDLSLSARINLLAGLSLSLHALCSSCSFCLASSCSFSCSFHSKLLKIQVTLLNNLSRKSFGRSHQIAHSGLRNHIPFPQL